MKPQRPFLVVMVLASTALALAAAGCRGDRVASARESTRPPGEVWVSASQMKNAKIDVSEVQEEDVWCFHGVALANSVDGFPDHKGGRRESQELTGRTSAKQNPSQVALRGVQQPRR